MSEIDYAPIESTAEHFDDDGRRWIVTTTHLMLNGRLKLVGLSIRSAEHAKLTTTVLRSISVPKVDQAARNQIFKNL